MISINNLVDLIADIAGKTIRRIHIDGPLGVRGRKSDNELIENDLGWSPKITLKEGIRKTYEWIEAKVKANELDIK